MLLLLLLLLLLPLLPPLLLLLVRVLVSQRGAARGCQYGGAVCEPRGTVICGCRHPGSAALLLVQR
jgi:hypothetical protein